MTQEITCINCPVGCRMTVVLSDMGDFLSVTGNTCARGAKYAEQECLRPMRMITAVIPAEDSPIPVSVKTSRPVPKEMIHDIMNVLAHVSAAPPVRIGQVIVENILGTGADIVATRNLG